MNLQDAQAIVPPISANVRLNTTEPPARERHLSPSQVNAFLTCSYAWYCKKELRLPDPPTAALAIGRAVHRTAAAALRGKGANVEVSSDELVNDFYSSFAREECAECEISPADSLAGEIARGEAMVRTWHAQTLPKIQPAVVERPVWGSIGGVHVRGIVDLVDTNACLIELKTSSRKPQGMEERHRFQLASYATLLDLNRARVDTLSANSRTSSYTPQTIEITLDDRLHCESIYPAVKAAMDAGFYLPNRASSFCSRRNCAFWKQCEHEWGGTVQEE